MISPLPIDIKLNHNETDDALMEPCLGSRRECCDKIA